MFCLITLKENFLPRKMCLKVDWNELVVHDSQFIKWQTQAEEGLQQYLFYFIHIDVPFTAAYVSMHFLSKFL